MDFVGEDDDDDNDDAQRCNADAPSKRMKQQRSSSQRQPTQQSSLSSSSAVKGIRFLYRVVEGSYQFSHAIQIAKSMELGDDIVNRATEALGALTGGRPLAPLDTEKRRQTKERNKRFMEEILRRGDMTEKDVEELRQWVREWNVSGESSLAMSGTRDE